MIDSFLFAKYFNLFIEFIEKESGSVFTSFPKNRYTEQEEGYKDEIYRKARQRLSYWEWSASDIGNGKIFDFVLSALKLDKNENNLVDWRLISKIEAKRKDNDLILCEKLFFDFYHDNISDKKSFESFVKLFGKKYPFIAYMYFLKDKTAYMPISPSNFDKSFAELGINSFKTSHNCDWDNYVKYNAIIGEARDALLAEGIHDVTLLNAHSFLWIISGIEDRTKKSNLSTSPQTEKLMAYRKLDSKSKEVVIQARNGQGFFRRQLINLWSVCSVTGCTIQDILTASHIKPWRECDNEEAIDVFNGLLLVPNIDKLFDSGLISFDDEGKIIISSKLNADDAEKLHVDRDMVLRLMNDNHKKYLEYHRKYIFK